MYTEEDLLPISALQHLTFCERQAALIHVEQQWAENVLTAEGHLLHEQVHSAANEARGDLRIARSLRLRSLELGLTGIADLVEFHRSDPAKADLKSLVSIPGIEGLWQPYIVEYKHGSPKIEHIDEVQLCAQAICLEEMLKIEIRSSAFFYGTPRRRQEVNFSLALREQTANLAYTLHDMVNQHLVPLPQYSEKCQSCSLVDVCMPKLPSVAKKVQDYLREAIERGN